MAPMSRDERKAGLALKAVLQAGNPGWHEKDIVIVLFKLAKVKIRNVQELINTLQSCGEMDLNARLRAAGQKGFRQSTLDSLRKYIGMQVVADVDYRCPQLAEPSCIRYSESLVNEEAHVTDTQEVSPALTPREVEQALTPRASNSLAKGAFSSMVSMLSASRVTPTPSKRRRSYGVDHFKMDDDTDEDEDEADEFVALNAALADSDDAEGVAACAGTMPLSAEADDFLHWLQKRPPLHRFDRGSAGLGWEYPLTKNEKRELLLLQVAAGEEEAAQHARDCVRLYLEKEKERKIVAELVHRMRSQGADRRTRVQQVADRRRQSKFQRKCRSSGSKCQRSGSQSTFSPPASPGSGSSEHAVKSARERPPSTSR